MAIGLSSAKPARNKEPRITELVKIHTYTPKKFDQIRLLPGPTWLVTAQHWVAIVTKKGEKKTIPKNCLAFNTDTEEYSGECPYCTELPEPDKFARKTYYANAIIRSLQEAKPATVVEPTKSERKNGYKDDFVSDSWTPVEVLRMPGTVVQKIQSLTELNVHKIDGRRKQVAADDPDNGVDFNIRFNNDLEGTDKYQIQKEDSSALDEEELGYLYWNLVNPDLFKVDTIEEAEETIGRILGESKKKSHDSEYDDGTIEVMDLDDADEDDEDDEDDEPKTRKPNVRPKKKRRPDPEEDDDLDLDEDDEPPRKPKARPKKKRHPDPDDLDIDDDIDIDLDEDDEDEDDEPPRKPKARLKKKRRPDPEEEDDIDLDEDDI